jgi:hypothetical protein
MLSHPDWGIMPPLLKLVPGRQASALTLLFIYSLLPAYQSLKADELASRMLTFFRVHYVINPNPRQSSEQHGAVHGERYTLLRWQLRALQL